jgi:hypothetical protein
MASNAFKNVAGNIKSSKNLDTVLVGSGYLGEGIHDVTIKSVGPRTDREGNEIENQVEITFVGEGDREHRESVYLTNKEGTELGYALRLLLGGLIPDKTLLEQFMDAAGEQGEKALEMFTGMKCRVTLKPSPGFQARSLGNGKFAAFEVDKKGVVGEQIAGTEYDDIKDAQDAAKAQGFYRSWPRITAVTATSVEGNAAAFATAIANKGKVKPVTKAPKAV